jgi:hypothetical protein
MRQQIRIFDGDNKQEVQDAVNTFLAALVTNEKAVITYKPLIEKQASETSAKAIYNHLFVVEYLDNVVMGDTSENAS